MITRSADWLPFCKIALWTLETSCFPWFSTKDNSKPTYGECSGQGLSGTLKVFQHSLANIQIQFANILTRLMKNAIMSSPNPSWEKAIHLCVWNSRRTKSPEYTAGTILKPRKIHPWDEIVGSYSYWLVENSRGLIHKAETLSQTHTQAHDTMKHNYMETWKWYFRIHHVPRHHKTTGM